jgi:hypothetical protein
MLFYRGMTCENVTIKGDKGTPITAYVAKPSGPGPFHRAVATAGPGPTQMSASDKHREWHFSDVAARADELVHWIKADIAAASVEI